jgi:hypothetical protein
MTPNPLAPLAAFRQFIAVRLVPLADGKTDKLPLTPEGYVTPKDGGGAHNPAYWMSWAEAHALAARLGPGHGVGFVLQESNGLFCIDIDNCIKPDGTYTPIVHELAAQLGPHVVWELSQSGRGLHLWMRATLPAHRKKNIPLGLEGYTGKRFIALGQPFAGDMDEPCPGALAVAARYFPPNEGAATVPHEGPVTEWRGPADDDELLRRAMQSSSKQGMFGGQDARVDFADLWNANEDALRRRWPDANGGYDASAADGALAAHLAFWTGKDVARIERLMRRSALAREKWDSRSDYLVDRTIVGACAKSRDVLVDKPSAVDERQAALEWQQHQTETWSNRELGQAPGNAMPAPQRHVPAPVPIAGRAFATRDDQLKLFAGCVYVVDQHRVLTPDGRLLRPEQFRALHGGYCFMLGGVKNKTTNSAWEAFTENQDVAFPRAASTCFRPDLPFGVVEDGRVNTFVPPNVRMVPGDATPFLNHLKRLLPRGDDATILLSYLAACVQYPGRKFQWAPVIQGVEGNGKTFFSIVAAYAVGEKYVHWPKASKLVKQFNAWMVGKILYCVEDIYLPNVGGDVVMEELKPMVTGGRGLEIEGKGVDQYSADICGNFVINTNHKDGLRKQANDRRWAMLYCAQQDQADLKRDFGDAGDYMRKLYEWLDHADGKAICAHYLAHYQIPPQFDPLKGAVRAPLTSSTEEAIVEGLGMVEQLVLEAIEERRVGFKGGWVSTTFLKHLLEAAGRDRSITPARRKNLMKAIGYVPHPGMAYGRVHNVVQPDNATPVLFVRPDSPQVMPGATPAEIAKAYTAAQS